MLFTITPVQKDDLHVGMILIMNIDLDKKLKQNIENQIKETNLLVIGEIHGIKTNIDVYRYLLKIFQIDYIAIEWPNLYKQKLEEYKKDDKINKKRLFENTINDGRFSIEMLDFLKEVENNRTIKNIICFDNCSSDTKVMDWNRRDQEMAAELIKKIDRNFNYMVIAGNLHTKKEPFETEFEKGMKKPMGSYLKNYFGNYPLINIKFKTGSLYNMGIVNLGNRDKTPSNKIVSMENNNYEVILDEAFPIDYSFFEK